ncbi:hypothetical protein EXIGLDRAFT_722081, partial [Exidia glandulosa HHB12029]
MWRIRLETRQARHLTERDLRARTLLEKDSKRVWDGTRDVSCTFRVIQVPCSPPSRHRQDRVGLTQALRLPNVIQHSDSPPL